MALRSFLGVAFIFSLFLGGSSALFAHKGEHHHHDENDPESEMLHKLHEEHELMEVAPSKIPGMMGKVVDYFKKLDLLELRGNIVRTYWKNSNRDIRPRLLDIIFLVSLSHPIETLSAPFFASMGTIYHWPGWLTTATTAAGAIIAVPGLDPLCILLIGGYIAVKPYRKGVNAVRVFSTKAVKGVFDILGISSLTNSVFRKIPRLDWFVAQKRNASSFKLKTIKNEDTEIVMQFVDARRSDEIKMTLYFAQDSTGESWLESVQFRNDLSKEELSEMIDGLGWNLESIIRKLYKFRLNEKPLEKFYIKSHSSDAEKTIATFEPGSIHLSSKRELTFYCPEALAHMTAFR